MDSLPSKISYIASGFISSLSFVTTNEFALLFGMLLGLATFIINWIYKHKNYKLNVSVFNRQAKNTNKNSDFK